MNKQIIKDIVIKHTEKLSLSLKDWLNIIQQKVVDSRVKQINKFISGIVDRQIVLHPLRSNIIIIFNETVYDIYRDATSVEADRVNKLAIVEKDKDIFYIQEWLDEPEFLDAEGLSPWVITMSLKGLPRVPKQDDHIVIDGRKHTVHRVKPINKRIESVISVLTYPERENEIDLLELFKVILYSDKVKVENINHHYDEDVILEFVYGGKPTHYKVGTGSWVPFNYRIKVNLIPDLLVSIKDETTTKTYTVV